MEAGSLTMFGRKKRKDKEFRPGVRSRANFFVELLVGLVFIAVFILFVIISSSPELAPMARSFYLTIAIIAVWRYTWLIAHLFRARRYDLDEFPLLREEADEAGAAEKVEHHYVLITSYFLDLDHTFAVYDSIVKNALDYGVPTTVVAAITDEADEQVLRNVLKANGNPSSVEIVAQFQSGEGKRAAMAEALRTIARRLPSPNSVVTFMDGDVRLDPNAFAKTIPFFLADPELGALTTNNGAVVEGNSWVKEWYALRYAQRQVYMASLSLSERVLCLTGRFSMYRTEIVTDPDFIEIVENDSIRHWRFGEIEFMSGDDKSTWYYMLRAGHKMLYIPDVFAIGYEALPEGEGFFTGTTSLMVRWFRNMLQTNWRSVGLGPGHMGWFVWWAIFDQRLSMWTTLVGPVVAILLAMVIHPAFILFYFTWVMGSRFLTAVAVSMRNDRFSMLWPILMYYNQMVGSSIKTHVLFRLNQQGWTRQNIGHNKERDRFQDMVSTVLHVATLAAFVLVVSFYTGLLNMPGDGNWVLWRVEWTFGR